jgi:hypothetical protein
MSTTAASNHRSSKNVAAATIATAVTIAGLAAGGIALSTRDGTATQAPATTREGPPPPVTEGRTHPHGRHPQLLMLRLHGGHTVISYP